MGIDSLARVCFNIQMKLELRKGFRLVAVRIPKNSELLLMSISGLIASGYIFSF